MAVGDAYVFPGFLKPVLQQFSFQSHQLIFSHASEVRGANTPERKFDSTWYQTHNHQVMSQTCAPLSHLGGLIVTMKMFYLHNYMKCNELEERMENILEKGENDHDNNFSPFQLLFSKAMFVEVVKTQDFLANVSNFLGLQFLKTMLEI